MLITARCNRVSFPREVKRETITRLGGKLRRSLSRRYSRVKEVLVCLFESETSDTQRLRGTGGAQTRNYLRALVLSLPANDALFRREGKRSRPMINIKDNRFVAFGSHGIHR